MRHFNWADLTLRPALMPDATHTQPIADACAPSQGSTWPGLTTAQSLAVASQFGVSLAIGVGLGLVAGQRLDGQIHSGMLFTLGGVLAGLILGITSIVSLYRATLRSSEREWRGETARRGTATRH